VLDETEGPRAVIEVDVHGSWIRRIPRARRASGRPPLRGGNAASCHARVLAPDGTQHDLVDTRGLSLRRVRLVRISVVRIARVTGGLGCAAERTHNKNRCSDDERADMPLHDELLRDG